MQKEAKPKCKENNLNSQWKQKLQSVCVIDFMSVCVYSQVTRFPVEVEASVISARVANQEKLLQSLFSVYLDIRSTH